MTQEDKDLLLKDLSARLLYGVALDVDTADWKAPQGHIKVKMEGFGILFKDMSLIVNGSYYGDNYKPFLRSMSSMTKEEKETYYNLCYEEEREEYEFGDWVTRVYYHDTIDSIDYLNSIHIDYRGLIKKGLALETPEGMYSV